MRLFQDVMDKGFKVVTRDSSASHEWLKMAAEGSPMQKYYQDYMHDNPGTKFNRDSLLSCYSCFQRSFELNYPF